MADQPTLSEKYDEIIARSVNHLLQAYNGRELTAGKATAIRWVAVTVSCARRDITLQLGLSPCFPDEFPTVKVVEHGELRIPHLNRQGVLCLFDNELAVPNPEQPIELLDAILERAKRLLNDGLSGINRRDYADELDSYWSETTSEKWLSLIHVGDTPKEIRSIHYQSAGTSKVLLADSMEQGQRWLTNLGLTVASTNVALFLPIDSMGVPPFPDTNEQLLGRLIAHSPGSVPALLRFLSQLHRPATVVACIKQTSTTGPSTLIAWQHQAGAATHKSGKRRSSAFDELHSVGKSRPVRKCSVVRLDPRRLQYRGGEGTLPSGKAAVIGCGSVGSHLAKMLSDAGVDHMTLVDPEVLSYDNVARHFCGVSSVGKLKVSAVKDQLVSHSPSIHCISEPVGALQLLRKSPDTLNGLDVVLVAVANYPVERRLSELAAASQITSPLLFVWVEPFMAGGHAFWQPPGSVGCFKCLFRHDGSFKAQVLKDPHQYVRRESGCQTSFSPYAILETKRFLSPLSVFVQDAMTGSLQGPTLFTWLGPLSTMRAARRPVHSMWAGADDYSYRTVTLSDAWYCEECR